MRLIAGFFSLIALLAIVWAGQAYWVARTGDLPEATTQAMRPPSDEPQGESPVSSVARWPDLFGELKVEEPQPPAPPAAPQPPKPAMPPLESLGYSLKGVVRDGEHVWAMVSHPTGDVILRVGDSLIEGMVVDAIDDEGLWVSAEGKRTLLKFPE